MISSELWETALKLIGALIIILPLAYLATRLYALRLAGSRRQRALRVVDAITLGPQRSIYLVEVGDRILVIAATQRHMTLLSEIQDEQFLKKFKEPVERS